MGLTAVRILKPLELGHHAIICPRVLSLNRVLAELEVEIN